MEMVLNPWTNREGSGEPACPLFADIHVHVIHVY